MSSEISYYFMQPEKFPVPGFLDGIKKPDEILLKAKSHLKAALVDPDIKENHAVVKCGANCVTQPGTHIGPYTWIFPMTNVRGFIPREKRVFLEQKLHMDDNGIVELNP